MRSILEQAVIHHLNGDEAKAQELFHQFIVTRARQIHESMRNGEDPLAEGWDDKMASEEYFDEGELGSLEDGDGEHAEAGDDFGGEGEDLDGAEGDDAAADDLGDDMGLGDGDEDGDDLGGDIGGEADGLEDKIDDMESSIQSLEAKLDELLANFDSGEDLGDDDATDMQDDMSDTAPGEAEDEGFPMESAEEVSEDDDGDDEDFSDLGESVTSELEKVTPKVADATEVGTGGKINGNATSTLPQKNSAARQGGSPVHTKQSQHKGFEREAAPAVSTLKPRRNNVPKADAALSAVAAPSNKKEATEVGASGKKVPAQTKSPVVPSKGLTK